MNDRNRNKERGKGPERQFRQFQKAIEWKWASKRGHELLSSPIGDNQIRKYKSDVKSGLIEIENPRPSIVLFFLTPTLKHVKR